MKDIEIFKKFMEWMGMSVLEERKLNDGETMLIFSETTKEADNFTCRGYDEFDAGIIFDQKGKMIKGYIDSHVCYSSKNCELMQSILKANP